MASKSSKDELNDLSIKVTKLETELQLLKNTQKCKKEDFMQLDQQIEQKQKLEQEYTNKIIELQENNKKLEEQISEAQQMKEQQRDLDNKIVNVNTKTLQMEQEIQEMEQQLASVQESSIEIQQNYKDQLKEYVGIYDILTKQKNTLLENAKILDDNIYKLKQRIIGIVKQEQMDSFRILQQYKYRIDYQNMRDFQ